jgi:multidrug efflux system outer membrane protein
MKRLLPDGARCALAAVSLALLAGCAATPAPAPPAVAVASMEAPEAADLDAWWRLFDDPVLDAMIEQALTASPDARIIAARIEAAQAARREALSANRPQGDLGLEVSGRRNDRLSGDGALVQPGTSAAAQVSLPVSWEIDFWGRRAVRAGVADADLASARFALEAGRALLAAQTAETVLAIRAADMRLAEATAQAAIQEELARLARARAARGLSPRSDVAPLEAALASTEAAIAGLGAERDANRRALAGLLGEARGPDRDVGPLPTALPLPPRVVDAALLARRPDVREAQAALEAAAGRARLARLALFPNLVWSPTAGLTRVLEPGLALGGFWSMGLGLTVPVLDRARLNAVLGGETARSAEAAASLEKVVQTALVEADRGFILLDAETRRGERLRAAEDAARRGFEAARRRYDAGLDSIDPVLAAERTWREARSAELDARISRIDRTIQLFKALGGGWSPAGAVSQTESVSR